MAGHVTENQSKLVVLIATGRAKTLVKLAFPHGVEPGNDTELASTLVAMTALVLAIITQVQSRKAAKAAEAKTDRAIRIAEAQQGHWQALAETTEDSTKAAKRSAEAAKRSADEAIRPTR